MLKVFLRPGQRMSRAMFRVAHALERHAPNWVQVVSEPERADALVLHCIGPDAFEWKIPKPFVLIQYCVGPSDPRFQLPGWKDIWQRASMVWSYFDLQQYMPQGANFYHSPLGVDPIFTRGELRPQSERGVGIVTSGFINGPSGEAIEDVAVAARMVGIPVIHIGPPTVELMTGVPLGSWTSLYAVPDLRLATIYRNALWVSGLRYTEGFELPAIEGLACGARPILFDREDMHQWYDGHAEFVPECSGPPLIEALVKLFTHAPRAVSQSERDLVLREFAWDGIITTFWAKLHEALEPAGASSYAVADVGADIPGGGAM